MALRIICPLDNSCFCIWVKSSNGRPPRKNNFARSTVLSYGSQSTYFLPAPVINSRAIRWDRTSIRGLISPRLDRTPRLLTSKPRKSSSMNPSIATCALRKSASYILSAASSLSKPPATSVSIFARVRSSRRNCRASLSAKNELCCCGTISSSFHEF